MHATEVGKAAAKSCSMLSALAHNNYGWRKQYLVTVFHAMVSSKMHYAGPGWQGNTCHLVKLDVAQNKALRIITGQFKDAPLEAIRAESGVPSVKTQVDRKLMISKEKALRLSRDHPRKLAYGEAVPIRRADNLNWKETVDRLTQQHNLHILETGRQRLNNLTSSRPRGRTASWIQCFQSYQD